MCGHATLKLDVDHLVVHNIIVIFVHANAIRSCSKGVGYIFDIQHIGVNENACPLRSAEVASP